MSCIAVYTVKEEKELRIVVKIFAVIYLWRSFRFCWGVYGGNLVQKDKSASDQLSDRTVTQWAIFFVLAKWAIDRELPVQELARLWLICQLVLTVFAVAWGIKVRIFRRHRLVWEMGVAWAGRGAAYPDRTGVCVWEQQSEGVYCGGGAYDVCDRYPVRRRSDDRKGRAQEMLPVQIEELKAGGTVPDRGILCGERTDMQIKSGES